MRIRSKLRLIFAGWYPGRSVRKPFSCGPFACSAKAEDALREFGGLTIRCHDSSIIRMQPLECSDLFESIEYFAKRLGKSLCPVGDCEGADGFAIVVADDGTTYSVFVDELRGLGLTVHDALDSLIGGLRRSDVQASESLGTITMD